jgi:hypothetical protein
MPDVRCDSKDETPFHFMFIRPQVQVQTAPLGGIPKRGGCVFGCGEKFIDPYARL